MTTQSDPQPTSFVEIVAKNREPVSYVSIAFGVLFLALTLFWGLRWYNARDQGTPKTIDETNKATSAEKKDEPARFVDRGDYLPTAIWSGLLSVTLLVAGGWRLTRTPQPGREIFESRLWIMIVGGVKGLLTVLLGFVLLWRWQESLLRWINKSDIKEAQWVIAALAIVLVGLASIFLSAQFARAEERTSFLMRRWLYGFNAVLSGILLLLVLAVGNVVVFMKMPDNVITTAAGFKGLSDNSKEFLKTIREPVKIYLVMPENQAVTVRSSADPRIAEEYTSLYSDCRSLMRACEEENANIKAVYLSPATDSDEVKSTFKRLKTTATDYGMLVSFGENEELTEFISQSELVAMTKGGIAFQGEARLLTQINFLAGGAKRPIIYFTQSNQEPSITGPTPENPRSCREIVNYLIAARFEVKPLLLEEGKTVNLADAALVVIAAPHIAFRPEQEAMIRVYLTPKNPKALGGKILAFLPAFPDAKGDVSPTGLEALFADFGIMIDGKKRMNSFPNPDFPAEWVPGTLDPTLRERGHGLARNRLFQEAEVFVVSNVRPIRRGNGSQAMKSSALFCNVPGNFTYLDEKFGSDPAAIVDQIRKEGQESKTVREKEVRRGAQPFAAYAYDEEPIEGGFQEKWRIAAIGTDWFVNDEQLKLSRYRPENYMRITTLLCNALRDRPASMNIEPQALGTFNLPKNVDSTSLFHLPVSLVLLGIVAIGIGVWITRRK